MAIENKERNNQKIFRIILPLLLFVAPLLLGISLKYGKQDYSGGCGCENPLKNNGNFNPKETEAFFMNKEVIPLLSELPVLQVPQVLGDVSEGEKWIEIILSEQKLIAWQGKTKFVETLISSGKTGRTPTGEFRIWSKFKYTKMSGGSKESGTYYYLPNVPYTMYFSGDYGLHGTYWHNNFGHPMSHGCVNLPTVMAEKLFYWATPALPDGKNYVLANSGNIGTKVVIHN